MLRRKNFSSADLLAHWLCGSDGVRVRLNRGAGSLVRDRPGRLTPRLGRRRDFFGPPWGRADFFGARPKKSALLIASEIGGGADFSSSAIAAEETFFGWTPKKSLF